MQLGSVGRLEVFTSCDTRLGSPVRYECTAQQSALQAREQNGMSKVLSSVIRCRRIDGSVRLALLVVLHSKRSPNLEEVKVTKCSPAEYPSSRYHVSCRNQASKKITAAKSSQG